MARIRTIKPEFFRHLELYELERDSGLPIRIAFAGLFTVCDREGVFRWKAHELKLDVLPYDTLDFSDVLNALHKEGFIIKYESDGKFYGCIPTWSRHQVINNRESASRHPGPKEDGSVICEPEEKEEPTREPRVKHASSTRQIELIPEKEVAKATPKKEVSVAEKELYKIIKDTFEGISGPFTDFRREGAAIKRIITFAERDCPEDPKEQIRKMLIVFKKLKESKDKFWASQPYIPSVLSAGGIWPRVKQAMEKEVNKYESLDVNSVNDAMTALRSKK